ncbi:unnamed protein product [Vitrella brassicaformis CCMP3155]|uniref:Protein pelota homolog n=2 Tax=Vitrella brassicaformis TaxID=1169539 RepID=A0A0G4GRM0_VITBC|nr:unnamed protein product [Vitrella brassicaformis CCMP3155]|mmetsp:Transcript_47759/g.119472  ORF Transcript_47759/g.119472 Transcript_47759/m.119472 type:complete len:415 (+) Transcript_47759:101-1345(+)|eukprot:CEM33183.1 unnamed protein product [Vitrella brassicaformis CCMP3155]
MKVTEQNFEKDGGGVVTLIPEEAEDLWHIYNIVVRGDRIRAQTYRKVQREGSLGSTQAFMKKLVLTLAVKSVEYDGKANLIRFSGKNVCENEFIRLGQFHTVEVELNSNLSVMKSNWDFISRDRLQQAVDAKRSAEVAAILIDQGVANFYLLTSCLAKELCKVQVNIPKKRGLFSGHQKAIERFFQQVMGAIQQHIDFSVVKCVLVAGPGFVRDDFLKWMWQEAQTKGQSAASLLSNRGFFVSARASSAYKQALNEILNDPAVQQKLQDTQATKQVLALESFYHMLQNEPDRTCYGPCQVEMAVERGAVQTLLILDSLFRASNVSTRRRYNHIVEAVKQAGGSEAHIFSSMHVSGEQLSQLSGIAAILRFPLPELDELDDANATGFGAPDEEQLDDEDNVMPEDEGAQDGDSFA